MLAAASASCEATVIAFEQRFLNKGERYLNRQNVQTMKKERRYK